MAKCYFRRVEFYHFKAFSKFRIDLKEFNILVGPNNAGKSTIITAFRILSGAIRKANAKRTELVMGPNGAVRGHKVDLASISIAEENIYFNYDDSEPAYIKFELSNENSLILFFPENGSCNLIMETATGKAIETPTVFRSNFDCQIGFVPILGPVEHREPLYDKEAARLALFNYRAARNFRNIWYHYPERFGEFREILRQTWPGMDVEPPEVERVDGRTYLFMYCPERRVPREILWAGFGFQVWCQMLTHLIQSSEASIFLIDEPDIYLHSELQRQLLELLRNLGPDILVATHSTEIVTEANFDEIVIVDKEKRRSRRIQNPSNVENVFILLGSNINPILTQLAKTRRALFVEGKDFQIIGRFARKLKRNRIGNRSDFSVIPIEGFNPEKMKNLKAGMEATLGSAIVAAIILDRDYRSSEECEKIVKECQGAVDYARIHSRKEIENFLLVPAAIDRAAAKRISGRPDRRGARALQMPWAITCLEEFAQGKKAYVFSQFLSEARSFGRASSPGKHETEISEVLLKVLEADWENPETRWSLIPGKEALSFINENLQKQFGVSVTPAAIVDAMMTSEIPSEMTDLIRMLEEFSAHRDLETLTDEEVA